MQIIHHVATDGRDALHSKADQIELCFLTEIQNLIQLPCASDLNENQRLDFEKELELCVRANKNLELPNTKVCVADLVPWKLKKGGGTAPVNGDQREHNIKWSKQRWNIYFIYFLHCGGRGLDQSRETFF